MRVFIIFLLVFLNILHKVIFSQINDVTWQQCLGVESTPGDYSYSIEYHPSGIYIGVRILNNGPGITNYHGNSDSWIIKTDSIGNVIWEKCYGGSEGEVPEKILSGSDNEIILFNYSNSMDGDVQNGKLASFWIVKIDTIGNILWENSYGNRTCITRDALITPDGGLLMMGRILDAGGDVTVHYGGNDIWLCKIDSVGNIQWEKTLGNEGQDNALKIKLTSDTTILMVGGHYTSGGMIDCPDLGTDGADVWIVEIDLNGNILNQWCFGGSHNDLGEDIIDLEDGYVFVASTNSNDGHVSGLHGAVGYAGDIWVVKFDKQGNIIWQNCLGGSESEYAVYITQTEDMGYIVVGNTWSHDGDVSGNHSHTGYPDIWVVKIDSLGELEWQRCFGGTKTERFWGIHNVLKKSDYNYILAGQSINISGDVECDLYGFPDEDAWIFEIKDCNLFKPDIPFMPIGPDSLCTTTDTTAVYVISPAAGAWYYEWMLSPEEAGTITGSGLEATVNWIKNWEGLAEIMVRSANDCGYSDWSEVHLTWAFSCMDISELHAGKIPLYIYPNPARDHVVFEFKDKRQKTKDKNGEKTIRISNIFGQLVATLQVKSEKTVWDTREIKAGMYFYRVNIEGMLYCGKVIVRR